MSNASDFIIDYLRILKQYTGDATDVVIPDTVREIGEMPFFQKNIKILLFESKTAGQCTHKKAQTFDRIPLYPGRLCANLFTGGHSPRMRQPPPPLRISHAAAVFLLQNRNKQH